jgi:lysophospholipase L1-like esterase
MMPLRSTRGAERDRLRELRGRGPKGLTVAVLLGVVVLAGCGGGGNDGRPAATVPRAETSPFAPTPSDAPVPPRDAPVVAALGDSVTAGSPLWDPNKDVRRERPDAINPQSQYEYWAQALLDGRLRFRNCGVLGERTDEIAERLDRCARGAKVLVVQGGVNDIAQGRPVQEAARNLDAMVRRGQAAGLDAVLVEVLPWNNGFPDAVEPIKRLNGLIAGIGRRRGVQVLPFYTALEDPRSPGKMRANDTLDGNHPSVPGYRKLGRLVANAPAIRELARSRGPTG